MVLESQLEAQLQAARLESLLPVLTELGVERCDDIEFLEEQDIEKRSDITVIQKRRFFEWKASLLEIGSTASCESTMMAKMSTERQKLGLPRISHMPQSPSHCSSVSVSEEPSSSNPPQTARTRAQPLIQVLREMEVLDMALKEERARCAKLAHDLEEERNKSRRMAEELQRVRSIGSPAQTCGASNTEDLQEERKLTARLTEELEVERKNKQNALTELECARSARNIEETHAERQHTARLTTELQVERDRNKSMAEELERVRSTTVADQLHSARISEELQTERKRCKSIAEELERCHKANMEEELQEERKHSARLIDEKQANEYNHSRDIAVLEEMLEHAMTENTQLKAKVTSLEASTPPAWDATRSEVEVDLVSIPDTWRTTRDNVDTSVEHVTMEARNSAMYEPDARPSAMCERPSVAWEPDQEPRRTLADRLSMAASTRS
jgi:hypothetical protein